MFIFVTSALLVFLASILSLKKVIKAKGVDQKLS
jgi:hypothetical protein